ncbi:Ig-specific serine endopeptidase MIP [Mycoplasma nasistruthionis]|uniref:DUF31 domain-containing protein n=1 Tax=Mycoplasma nasistruthionis TaxID=353852 RepID=A0A5B7XVJ7_9MOLU|nr:DUF31 family protein [Mycoplasma nasistruthionis]QCZ36727.1 hypothetical protein FG904_01740 [Mycoplasma nasistruthionis]
MKLNKLLLLSLLSSPMALAASCQFGHSEATIGKPSAKPGTVNKTEPGKSNPDNPGDPTNPSNREGAPVVTDAPQDPPRDTHKENFKPAEADTDAYKKGTNWDKFNIDEKYYLDRLYRQFAENKEEIVAEINKTYGEDHVRKFDEKAKEQHMTSFFGSYLKNFSVPNSSNKLVLDPIKTILRTYHWEDVLGDRGLPREVPNQLYKNTLLQSYSIRIVNENQYLKESRSIPSTFAPFGTAWILDYKLDDTGTYPTKFYLATNLHVAELLIKSTPDDSPYQNVLSDAQMKTNADRAIEAQKAVDAVFEPTKEANLKYRALLGKYNMDDIQFEKKYKDSRDSLPQELIEAYETVKPLLADWEKKELAARAAKSVITGVTKRIDLIHYNPDTPIANQFNDATDRLPFADVFRFAPKQVKLVYAGSNFLNSSPRDYLDSDSPYFTWEEMADFAVLEFDFASESTNPDYSYNYYDTSTGSLMKATLPNVSTFASYITSGFADPTVGLNSKPANFDLLEKYDEFQNQKLTANGIEVPKLKYNFIALGFPNAKDDIDLIKQIPYDEGRKISLGYTSTLWVNKPFKPRKDVIDASFLGYGLSPNVALRTFPDKPGLTDILLASPLIDENNTKGFSVSHLLETGSPYQGKHFINYGLGYVLQSWEPGKGASGSSVRDVDNNIIGINYAAADGSLLSNISITQALRSVGYNYNGLYGDYNLEQYDLIYGGGKNQRTSYRQALQKIYGDNYKTKLFPQGTATIPEEYRFKES